MSLRVQEKGQQAAIAVLDSLDQAQARGPLTPTAAAEYGVALAAAEVVAHTGGKWRGDAADAAVRHEEAVARLIVALARFEVVGAS